MNKNVITWIVFTICSIILIVLLFGAHPIITAVIIIFVFIYILNNQTWFTRYTKLQIKIYFSSRLSKKINHEKSLLSVIQSRTRNNVQLAGAITDQFQHLNSDNLFGSSYRKMVTGLLGNNLTDDILRENGADLVLIICAILIAENNLSYSNNSDIIYGFLCKSASMVGRAFIDNQKPLLDSNNY